MEFAYLMLFFARMMFHIGVADAASVNVTLSSENVRNGTSMSLTASFDPNTGSSRLDDLECGYLNPASGLILSFTKYNRVLTKLELKNSLPSAMKARLSMISSGNPMVLNISQITFVDEKRAFFCVLHYYDSLGNPFNTESKRITLDNVYSPQILDKASSMQSSTSLTEGITSILRCIVTGRPASTVRWQYNSAINTTNSTTSTTNGYLITVKSVLSINNPVESMDGQQIKCLANHPFSSSVSKVTTFSVDYRPINTTLTISPQNPKLSQIIQLTCIANGKPAVSMYRFYVNDTSIGNSTNGSLSVNANDCLKFNGYFKCAPENSKGQGKIKQQLIVVTDDVKTSVASASVTFYETTNATLSCTVSGCPVPSVSWSKNEVSLKRYGNSIALTSLTKSDAGQYSCNAQNAYTNSSSQIQVTVKYHYKPIATTFSTSNMKPLATSPVIFNCTSDAVPAAKYRFHRVDTTGENLVSSSGSESNGILVVSSIMYTSNVYNVTYKCTPYNMLGNGLEKAMTLDIQVSPEISVSPAMTVTEGGSAVLECNVTAANPSATVTWRSPSNAVIPHTNGRLRLPMINRNQHGSYTCWASNGVGSATSKTTSITINYGPEFNNNSTEIQKCIGDKVRLLCNAFGRPIPTVKLFLNGFEVESGSGNLSYIIPQVVENQFGKYMCVANHIVKSINISLDVKKKPSGAVENVKMKVDQNVIEVTWTLPTCNGNIRQIRVEYRKKGETKWQAKTANPTDTKMTITGLEKDSEYEVRAVTVDINGQEHIAKAIKTPITDPGRTASFTTSDILLFTLLPICFVIIIALVIWILRLKRQVANSSGKGNEQTGKNDQRHYMDLQLNDINPESQQYATMTNPGAVAYEQIPVANSHYMDLGGNRDDIQTYTKLSKDYEVIASKF